MEFGRLTAAVDRLWPKPAGLPELMAHGPVVEALMAHPGFPAVLAVLDDELRDIDSKLDSKPLDAAEYTFLHGRRNGLKGLREASEAIVSRSNERRAEQAAKHEGAAESAPGR